ncbi:TetR/AcrR family transcriptional regulator [Granulicoccus phenolivorans]|uniref:TetR/AcrR family transcriptional regulator n=1 Tax=Granulicoccus phenolivorans TaxID=266854 RepID=UPI00138ADA6C|nr:TetR family transcriptional regulator [Granulicoccus phenolivorans]
MAGQAGHPRKRDAARTKRQILTAAGRRFARQGYSHTTLQQIAIDAGITAAMINHHFGSKLELLNAVGREEWGLDTDPLDRAERTVTYWNDPNLSSPALAMVRSLDQPAALQTFRSELERRITSRWRKELKGPHVEERLRLILGVAMGYGLFTTGRLVDADAEPLDKAQMHIMINYLERIFKVLTDEPVDDLC